MSRRSPLSLIVGSRVEPEQAIVLTEGERAAVIELGLRPTYGLHHGPTLDVDSMLANATAWMQAAEITSAGSAGWIPSILRGEIAELLNEAIPESVLDLESTVHSRDRWRAGDAGQGFPELGSEETEELYEELIENEQRNVEALTSIASKLDADADAPRP